MAWADKAQHISATAAMNQRVNAHLLPLWKVFEFLNDNFILFLQRILFACNYKKSEVNRFLPRRGDSRRKFVFGDYWCSRFCGRAPQRFEGGASRLPMQRMSQNAPRLGKLDQIAWNVKRLNFILRISLTTGVSPSADRQIQLSKMLLTGPLIVSIQSENCRWFQMRSVAHNQNIIAVAKAPGKENFCTRPPVGLLFDAEMQSPPGIDPGIVGVV